MKVMGGRRRLHRLVLYLHFRLRRRSGGELTNLSPKHGKKRNTEETNLTHKGVEIAFSKACAPARRALTSVWRQFILRRDSRCASDGKHKQIPQSKSLLKKKNC